jgi:hypothetical protein
MKRSREIVLALIASVSLTACEPDTQATKRDMYKNRDDCAKDWDEKDCEDSTDSNGAHWYAGPHYYYMGSRPYYYPRGGEDPVEATSRSRFAGASPTAASSRASFATANTITRGGFGSSGGSFGSGRS